MDFSEVEIKGRNAVGNIVTKYPVRSIKKVSDGESTLGAKIFYFDAISGIVSTQKKGDRIGAFEDEEKLISIRNNGMAKLHEMKDPILVGTDILYLGKYDPKRVFTVLYFEGDPNTSYRLLRAAKNRFGSTNEIGVFEMLDTGLEEVPNPSQMLLEGRPEGASGTCVACVMEGTRPVLAEVQALIAKTTFNVPRRAADGFDFNRAVLLMAVAEKRAGMKLSAFDAYINVIGGLHLDEPGADLPVALAIASSYRDVPIADDLVAIGEVGLTGEIRAVSHLSQRLGEVSRLGFQKCMIPRSGSDKVEIPKGLTVYRVRNLREAIETAL